MGLHSEVDFRNSVDTGEANGNAIIPITDGEPANQTNLRRPTENNRARTDALRHIVRGHTILADLDRCGGPHLFSYYAAVITFNGAYSSYAGTFTLADPLYMVPLATPGEYFAPPYVGSTKATLSAEDGVNVMLFTAKYKQWEAPSGGDPAEAADGNNISVEIVDTGSLSVDVQGADGYVNNILIGIDYGTTTIQQVIDAVAAHVTASKLVVATAVSPAGNPAPKFSEAEWGTDYTARFLRGGAGGIAHIITNANLAAFFSAHTENLLQVGDTLAIWYDKLIDMSGTMKDGRFQSTKENTNQTIPSTAFFNTRREPEKIPNCIPICKCVEEDQLLFADGSYIYKDYPARLGADSRFLTLAQQGVLSTPLNWDRIGNGPDHNPPTTIRQALDNADGRLHSVMTEVEAARTNGYETPTGSHLDLEGRIDRLGDHSTMGGTIISVGFDGGGGVGFDEMYMGAGGLSDAINAIKSFATYRVGGTIQLWPGGTLQSYQIGATFPTINKPIHFVSPGVTYIRNNRGLGANQYVFDFTAGADGSTMENIHVIEDVAPSNKSLRLKDVNDITIRNCHFVGAVHIENCLRVRFIDCTFTEPTNGGGSEFYLVYVTGSNASACESIRFENCRFASDASGVVLTALVGVDTATNEFQDEQTDGVHFEQCYFDVRNNLRGLYTTTGRASGNGIYFKCQPYTADRPVFWIGGNGVAHFTHVQYRLANASGNYPITNYLRVQGSKVHLSDFIFDGQNTYQGQFAAGDNPIYLTGSNVTLEQWLFVGIIPASDGGGASFVLIGDRPLIFLKGTNGGKATLGPGEIRLMDDPGWVSGTSPLLIVGSGGHNDASGVMIIDGVRFMLVYASTYYKSVGNNDRRGITQLQRYSEIRNCTFNEGTGFFAFIEIFETWNVTVHTNKWDQSSTQKNEYLLLSNDGGLGPACRDVDVHDNHMFHDDLLGNAILLGTNNASSWQGCKCNNNFCRGQTGGTPTTEIAIGYANGGTCIGNTAVQPGSGATAITYALTSNMVPAAGSLASYNAMLSA